jgi:hypothetical protein
VWWVIPHLSRAWASDFFALELGGPLTDHPFSITDGGDFITVHKLKLLVRFTKYNFSDARLHQGTECHLRNGSSQAH